MVVVVVVVVVEEEEEGKRRGRRNQFAVAEYDPQQSSARLKVEQT